MRWAKRVGLFLAVNFLVIVMISLILSVFNVRPYLTEQGINFEALLIFCFIWGMGGALISLALSAKMAKWMMGVKVIDPNTRDPQMSSLLTMVKELSAQAGLPKVPEVGIYKSPEVNAFATGPTKKRALVAVSSGMLERMSRDQVEGVLGHELAHVANGDMVTMTLLQGVINAFVMFAARALAFVLMRVMSGDRNRGRSSPFMYHMIVIVLQIVFMILGSMVVAWFSRYREFRADAGGARFAGRNKMIGALRALQTTINVKDPRTDNESLQAFKISSGKSMAKLFATHPPLEMRIKRLEKGA